jgi:hypothetical protein
VLAACGGSGDDAPPACEPAVLFLDRDGATYTSAMRDDARLDASVLVDPLGSPLALAPWPHDDVDWASLVACIRTGLAPFPVEVTETDPGDVPHVELVFTTSYWAGSAGTTMIVPSACRQHEVGFVFGAALPTYARACHVALRGYAQMVARLSLIADCYDVLDDSADCSSMRQFLDRESECVDDIDRPAPCRCGGTTQNGYLGMTVALPACPDGRRADKRGSDPARFRLPEAWRDACP